MPRSDGTRRTDLFVARGSGEKHLEYCAQCYTRSGVAWQSARPRRINNTPNVVAHVPLAYAPTEPRPAGSGCTITSETTDLVVVDGSARRWGYNGSGFLAGLLATLLRGFLGSLLGGLLRSLLCRRLLGGFLHSFFDGFLRGLLRGLRSLLLCGLLCSFLHCHK